MSISRALPRAAAVATATLVMPLAAFVGPAAAEPPADEPARHAAAQEQPREPKGKGVGSQQPIDRSGSSDNPDGTFQGSSSSTPDQDGVGADHGADNNDKTGPGTDGNNGCGNEPRDSAATVDDDNNGRCLGLSKTRGTAARGRTSAAAPAVAAPAAQQAPSAATPAPATPTGVLSSGFAVAPVTDRPSAPQDVLSTVFGSPSIAVDAALLPADLDSGVAAGGGTATSPTTLPFTGAETTTLVALALGGVAAGSTLLVLARRRG